MQKMRENSAFLQYIFLIIFFLEIPIGRLTFRICLEDQQVIPLFIGNLSTERSNSILK